MDLSYDVFSKILLLGPCRVGKSNLVSQFVQNFFRDDYIATIGGEFAFKNLEYGDKKVKLQIWDTSGDDKHKYVVKDYYPYAAVLVVVFDITNEDSFKKIPQFLSEAKAKAKQDTKFILVGNKLDLSESRVVKYDEVKALAQDQGVLYLEASAKDDTNVNTIFMEAAGLILGIKAKDD